MFILTLMEFRNKFLLTFFTLCTICYAQEININSVVPKNYNEQMRPGNPLEG